MGIYEGLTEAPTFDRGNYMNPGQYVIRVRRTFALNTRASGLATIAEMDVLQSAFRQQEDPQGQGRVWQPTPAGVPGTWFQNMTDKNIALPAIKSFVRAVLGLASNDPRAEFLNTYISGSENWPGNQSRRPIGVLTNLMDHAISQSNILAGLCAGLTCSMIKTQIKGNRGGTDFTVYDFQPLDFATLGMPAPDVDRILSLAITPAGPMLVQENTWQAPGGAPPGQAPGTGYGFPPPHAAPPAGFPQQPPGPPPWTLPPGGQKSPDGKSYWIPGMANWTPIPSTPLTPAAPPGPPAWTPPKPSAPPWTLPPGGQKSPDGKSYWVQGMSTWAPIPSDDIPF